MKFHIEDPQILGFTVKQLSRHDDVAPGICVPAFCQIF
jgi:hypothetical protein